MKDAVQWVRSLVFNGQMYVMMLILAVIYLPWAIVDRAGAFAACHAYCRWVRWTASWMVGLKTEVRGTPPVDEVLIAAGSTITRDVADGGLAFGRARQDTLDGKGRARIRANKIARAERKARGG